MPATTEIPTPAQVEAELHAARRASARAFARCIIDTMLTRGSTFVTTQLPREVDTAMAANLLTDAGWLVTVVTDQKTGLGFISVSSPSPTNSEGR